MIDRKREFLILAILAVATLSFFASNLERERGTWVNYFPINDPDVALHARRVYQALGSVSGLPLNDSYSSFPHVIHYPYPPLPDFLYSLFYQGYLAFFPDSGLPPDSIIGWVPPLLGALLFFFLYLSIKDIAKRPGLALFVAVCWWWQEHYPFWFYNLDHHGFEIFFLWVFILAGLQNVIRPALIWRLGGILGLAGLVLSAPASLLWASLLTGHAFLFLFLFLVDRERFSWTLSWTDYAAFCLPGAGVLSGAVSLGLGYPLEFEGFGQSYSLFQPSFLLGVGLALALANGAAKRFSTRAFLGGGILILLVALTLPFQMDWINRGWEFLARKHPYFSMVDEQRSAFGTGSLRQSILRFWSDLGWWLPLAILGVPAWRWGGVCVRLVMYSLFGFMALLGFWALRYWEHFTPFGAVFLGTFFYGFLSRERHGGSGRWAVVILALVPLLFTGIHAGWEGRQIKISPDYRAVQEACLWLDRNSPPTSGFFDDKTPEYGVLSDSNWGNFIPLFARRPSVSCPLQAGYQSMAEVFLADGEAAAANHCREKKIRYLLLTDMKPSLFALYYLLKYSHYQGPWLMLDRPEMPSLPQNPEEGFFARRLYREMGLSGEVSTEGGSGQFRLVYVSPVKKGADSAAKIFEVGPGTIVQGVSSPHDKVVLRLPVTLRQSGKFVYERRVIADEAGRWEARVVYPCEANRGGVQTGKEYQVSVNGQAPVGAVVVKESDLEQGRTIQVNR